MSGFFKTKEYRFLQKIKERLMVIHTEKNYNKYKEHVEICKALVKESYGNIGYVKDSDTYRWDTIHKDKLPSVMICLGGYDEFNFVKNGKLYITEAFDEIKIRHEDGTVIHYNKEETDNLKHKSIKELQKIHSIKFKFEGNVSDGRKKRDSNS